jgi:hypothetical protein
MFWTAYAALPEGVTGRGEPWRKFLFGLNAAYRGKGSFDFGFALLREANSSLRMTK